jgi:hypothetical protein
MGALERRDEEMHKHRTNKKRRGLKRPKICWGKGMKA